MLETVRAGEQLVRRDGVTVTVLGGDTGVDEAVAMLDDAESQAQAPLVDEAERSRLHDLAAGVDGTPLHWHPLLATVDGRPTGYAGIVLSAHGGPVARSDLAPDRRVASCHDTVTALLVGLTEIANRHGTDRLHVWIRHATDDDGSCARSEGFQVQRALLVLGRSLDDTADAQVPAPVTIRSYRGGEDERGVVAVLREAHHGTPDGGWDLERFEERRGYDWFDPDDLLVATDGSGIAGLHWTKRRGDGVGEVYNLAVADHARGSGLGRALLRAGLRHLQDRGCHEAILWVDRSNDAAVRLYRSEGFSERWADVEFGRRIG